MFAIAIMELFVEEAGSLDPDPCAFGAFFEDALPRIYGYFLHRSGGSVSVAEDLTQETFLAAVAELKKGRRVEAPIRWIYGIARHKLLDHYRRPERDERAPVVEGYSALGEMARDEDAHDARDRAVAALRAVAASQRAALVLCYLDGFSVREIAAALGKSTVAVHSLLERGHHPLGLVDSPDRPRRQCQLPCCQPRRRLVVPTTEECL